MTTFKIYSFRNLQLCIHYVEAVLQLHTTTNRRTAIYDEKHAAQFHINYDFHFYFNLLRQQITPTTANYTYNSKLHP